MNRLVLAQKVLHTAALAVCVKGRTEAKARHKAVCKAVHLKQVAQFEGLLTTKLQDFFDEQLRAIAVELRKHATLENERAWHGSKKIRDYSCLMLEMPDSLAAELKRIGLDKIDDASVSEEGRETWFHITVLYGFHTAVAADVLDGLVKEGPIKFTIGKVSRFKGDDQDVAKIDIESDDLSRIRKIVEKHPNSDKHPEYHPHITLAYVKKDATGFEGEIDLTGKEFSADVLVFSSKNETKTEMRLDGKGKLSKVVKNCGTGAGGFREWDSDIMESAKADDPRSAAAKLMKAIFNPDEWHERLVEVTAPTIAVMMVRAALAQQKLMKIDIEKIAKAVKNCGTGAGGFQEGNTCASGGGNPVDKLAEEVEIFLISLRSEAGDYVSEVPSFSLSEYQSAGNFILVEVFSDGRVDILDGFHRAAGLLRYAVDNNLDLSDIRIPVIKVNDAELASAVSEPGKLQAGAIERIHDAVDIKNDKSVKSTATAWLFKKLKDANGDSLVGLLRSFGKEGIRLATEIPLWMKLKIGELLHESFGEPYWKKINETTATNIENYLARGLTSGQSIRTMANNIASGLVTEGDTASYAKVRAKNIAITESGFSLNGARTTAYDNLKEVLADKPELTSQIRRVWLSILGPTTRDAHADLDGVPEDDDGMWDLNGVMCRWPSDITLPPSDRCRCQCTTIVQYGMDREEARGLLDEYGRRVIEREQGAYDKPVKVFCPTGEGGGVDPTCSPGGTGGVSDIEAARQDWIDNGTKAKAFKKWFGDWENDPANASKVVDGDGKPQENYGIKKVYHGAPVEFSVFDKEKLGVNGVAAGLGFYFSENIEIANTYANSQKGVVFESYLNIRNPYDFDSRISKTEMLGWEKHASGDLGKNFNAKVYRQKVESAFEYHGKNDTLSGERAWNVLREEANDWRVNKILARAGYDGVTHLSGDMYGSTLGDGTFRGDGYGRVWVAFDSAQIKSATGNQGTFDPSSLDINKSVRY